MGTISNSHFQFKSKTPRNHTSCSSNNNMNNNTLFSPNHKHKNNKSLSKVNHNKDNKQKIKDVFDDRLRTKTPTNKNRKPQLNAIETNENLRTPNSKLDKAKATGTFHSPIVDSIMKRKPEYHISQSWNMETYPELTNKNITDWTTN